MKKLFFFFLFISAFVFGQVPDEKNGIPAEALAKAIELAKKEGADYSTTQEFLDKIKEMK